MGMITFGLIMLVGNMAFVEPSEIRVFLAGRWLKQAGQGGQPRQQGRGGTKPAIGYQAAGQGGLEGQGAATGSEKDRLERPAGPAGGPAHSSASGRWLRPEGVARENLAPDTQDDSRRRSSSRR